MKGRRAMEPNEKVALTHSRDLSRRDFLALSAGAVALGMLSSPRPAPGQAAGGWNDGQVAHLIPTARHDRFLIKASFKAPLVRAPRLSVSGKSVEGVQTDGQGRFWRFDVPSLQPATLYELQLTESGGSALCDAWPLKTFPAPDSAPDHLRILAYTCAGGYDGPAWNYTGRWLS